MIRFLSIRQSCNIMIVAFALLIAMHVLIVLGLIPYESVWGGQIHDRSTLLTYEVAAVALLLAFTGIVAAKAGYLAVKMKRTITAGLWVIAVFFLLNTVGNLTSGLTFELLLFAPLTIIMTILAVRLAVDKHWPDT